MVRSTHGRDEKPTPWSRVLEKLTVIRLVKNIPAFYGLKGSLPCSQQPATGPYAEADASSIHS